LFKSNALVPAEAVRLAALGMLAEEPRRYSDLAVEIRQFTSRIVGPSLDLMGTSLELLRYEELIEGVGGTGMEDDAVLRLTEKGRAALMTLLSATLSAPVNEVNRLVLALKLRFLHLLSAAERREQIELIALWCEGELARLEDLRRRTADGPALLLGWLDLDIAHLRARLDWLNGVSAAL
jgi:DNA-binding PadR family transcriptional regulator